MELADAFSKGGDAPNIGVSPPCLPPKVADQQLCEDSLPTSSCKIVRADGKEETLIEALDRDLDAIPDWYSALDRIYAITDMALVSQKPKPFVGDASLAGAPGFSYLIAKGS